MRANVIRSRFFIRPAMFDLDGGGRRRGKGEKAPARRDKTPPD